MFKMCEAQGWITRNTKKISQIKSRGSGAIVRLVECFPSIHEALDSIPAPHKLGTVVPIY